MSIRLAAAVFLAIAFWEVSGDPLRSGVELIIWWAIVAAFVGLVLDMVAEYLTRTDPDN